MGRSRHALGLDVPAEALDLALVGGGLAPLLERFAGEWGPDGLFVRLGSRGKVADGAGVGERPVDRELEEVVEHLGEEPPADGRAKFEAGVHVALDEEVCEPAGDHEVEPEELEAVGALETI